MYKYEKRLQYPIDIKRKDLKMAKFIIAQYGGHMVKWGLRQDI